MTTPLQINGMPFAIEEGSLDEKQIEIGMRKRAVDGTPWGIVQSVRKEYSFSSIWLTLEEARFWKSIFGGQTGGFTASFDAGTNTDQGHRARPVDGYGVLGAVSSGALDLNVVETPSSWSVPFNYSSLLDWSLVYRAGFGGANSGAWIVTPNDGGEGWVDVVQLAGTTYTSTLVANVGGDGFDFYEPDENAIAIYSVIMFDQIVPASLQAGLGAYVYADSIVAAPDLDFYGDLTGLLHRAGQAEYKIGRASCRERVCTTV